MRLCAINFRRRPRRRRAHRNAPGGRVAVAVVLLVYQALFLNVFVPSHTPGMITVDGSAPVAADVEQTAAGGAHHCCATGRDADGDGNDDKRRSDDSKRSRCAVCQLVARLTPAVAVDLKLPEHGLLELLPALRPHVAASAAAFPTYLGRGPPAGARVIPVV